MTGTKDWIHRYQVQQDWFVAVQYLSHVIESSLERIFTYQELFLSMDCLQFLVSNSHNFAMEFLTSDKSLLETLPYLAGVMLAFPLSFLKLARVREMTLICWVCISINSSIDDMIANGSIWNVRESNNNNIYPWWRSGSKNQNVWNWCWCHLVTESSPARRFVIIMILFSQITLYLDKVDRHTI